MMRIAIRPKQNRTESLRNYQSLQQEMITFLDYFNDKVLRLYSVLKLDPLLYLIRFCRAKPWRCFAFCIFVSFIKLYSRLD